jgi:hypothetical protein
VVSVAGYWPVVVPEHAHPVLVLVVAHDHLDRDGANVAAIPLRDLGAVDNAVLALADALFEDVLIDHAPTKIILAPPELLAHDELGVGIGNRKGRRRVGLRHCTRIKSRLRRGRQRGGSSRPLSSAVCRRVVVFAQSKVGARAYDGDPFWGPRVGTRVKGGESIC